MTRELTWPQCPSAQRTSVPSLNSRVSGTSSLLRSPACVVTVLYRTGGAAARLGAIIEGSSRVSSEGSDWRGWLEEAQDQKSRFPAELLVVLGMAFAHCLGWDRLDEFFDQESGISGSRAQG